MVRGLILAAALAVGLSSAASAQSPQEIYGSGPTGYDMFGATRTALYCQIQVTTTPTKLSDLLATAGCAAVVSKQITAVTLTAEATGDANGVAIRWRSDGVTQAGATTYGSPVFGWTPKSIYGYPAINALSLISSTGGSVTVDVVLGG